jgi:predicted metal-binding transcription factor (methanogenesis marker protein 9)
MDFPKVQEQKVSVGNTICFRNVAERYKALVDPDSGHLYGILGVNYQTLPHEHAFEMVMETLKGFPEYGTPTINPIFLKDGARMIGKVRFPEVNLPIVKDDYVQPEIQVYNSYDGGWSFEIGFGAYMVTCANGAKVFEKMVQFRKKHYQNVFYMEEIKNILNEGLKKFSDQTEIWRAWADKKITEAQAQKVIEEMQFGKRETQKLVEEVEMRSGLTLKDHGRVYYNKLLLFFLLTQLITHSVKSEIRKRELSARLSRTLV